MIKYEFITYFYETRMGLSWRFDTTLKYQKMVSCLMKIGVDILTFIMIETRDQLIHGMAFKTV